MRFRISASMIVLLSAMSAAESAPTCKAVTRYGVSGCEMLADQTCPPGYHKRVVDPPDPRMKAPSYLMCVADKPQPKKHRRKTPPKSNR